MSNNKLQQIINFFELEEGYSKNDIISDILKEIKGLKNYDADEIGLEWDGEHLMTLNDFVNEFYYKLIEGVCNVIESFKKEK